MSVFSKIAGAAQKAVQGVGKAAKYVAEESAKGWEESKKENEENVASNEGTTQITLGKLPCNLRELKGLDSFSLQNPHFVAAASIVALNAYSENRDEAIEMLNFLKGPQPLSPMDIQFINDRFMDGKDYVTRSYFAGATPENNYQPSVPYTIMVQENQYSREQEGYLKLFLISNGADSPREVVLRHKPSTDEWFLWKHEGLLSMVREPIKNDVWA